MHARKNSAQLEAQLGLTKGAFDASAVALSAKRHNTATALSQAVMAELPALKLERARFMVEVTSDAQAAAAEGIDIVEFHVQTNPGTRPGPIMKVASGGELSRFLLALKVALADRGSAPTLVFDEIDTGVGGAVADAIGQRLKRLSKTVQVLSVTHAPQVAARAATHLLISKGPSAEKSETIATPRRPHGRQGPHRRDRPHARRRLGDRRGEGGCSASAGGKRLVSTLPLRGRAGTQCRGGVIPIHT